MPAPTLQSVDARRIGFLADTHWRANSELSQQLLDAFTGVDLIVHLGDVGQEGNLERLRAVAPVMVPKRGQGHVIEAGGVRIGMVFDITKPGVAVKVGEAGMEPPAEPMAEVLASKFGGDVAVVAFAGTHRQLKEEHAGVLFFNPGSPTLPSDRQSEDDQGSVAVLEVAGGKADVRLVRLSYS
jgi:putative phosphoesterase